MNRAYLKMLAFALALLGLTLISGLPASAQTAPESRIKLQVDWEKFLQRQDPVWECMPTDWYESFIAGNGMLGLMVYQNGPKSLRLDIGRADVEDHRKTKNAWHQLPRLPIGYFTLDTAGEIQSGTGRIDLWNAESRGTIKTTVGQIEWRAIVHAERMVILFETKASGDEQKATLVWHPLEAVSPARAEAVKSVARGEKNDLYQAWAALEYPPSPPPALEQMAGVDLCHQRLVDGGEHTTAWHIESISETRRILRVSVAQSYPGVTSRFEALEAVTQARLCPLDDLIKTHRAWWHAYYPGAFVSFPDARWESFYWIQIYKLASATRGDRALIDQMGPWFARTIWANAWFNLNIQLTYSFMPAANRLEMGASLPNTLDRCLPQLIANMPPEMQADSAGLYTIAPQNLDSPFEMQSLGDLPWTCHDYWLYYRHTMDDRRLREGLYPLLRRAIGTYYHVLKEGPDGRLHLPPTVSPEYGIAPDCNYNLAMLRWGCQTLIEICQRLQIDDPLLPKWRSTLERMPEYPVDETGFMVGAGVPFERPHPTYSHLLMVYPLYLVNIDQPGAEKMIRKSLNHWLERTPSRGGYTNTGASSIASAIGDGNQALEHLNHWVKSPHVAPTCNTMYKEGGDMCPCMETPFSAGQSIQNMLLQSWGGKIRVFPAVPDDWPDAAFHDLRAEGAFLVSAARTQGRTRFVRIRSLAGEPCIVKTDLAEPVQLAGPAGATLEKIAERTWRVNLAKDQELVLTGAGDPPDLTIRPAGPPDQRGTWGKRMQQ